jgi:hypothetical protein
LRKTKEQLHYLRALCEQNPRFYLDYQLTVKTASHLNLSYKKVY